MDAAEMACMMEMQLLLIKLYNGVDFATYNFIVQGHFFTLLLFRLLHPLSATTHDPSLKCKKALSLRKRYTIS